MDDRRWLLDELAHAGREHVDARSVAAYERKAAFDPAEDVALLRGLDLDERAVLVDLGAGTGAFALAAAPFCRRVVAVDVSPAMVAEARRATERRRLDNVEVVRAGFLTYEHAGEPADVVYSRNALHHLPDFWKVLALERIAGMLRPGGLLRLRDLAFSCEPSEATAVVDAWLAGAPERADAGWRRGELEAHLREEHSTFTWLLEPMLERAGFEIAEARYDPSRVHAAYISRRRSV